MNGRRQRADGTWTTTTPEWDAKWYWPVGTRVRVRGGRVDAIGTVATQNAVTVWVQTDDGRRLQASMAALTRVEGS